MLVASGRSELAFSGLVRLQVCSGTRSSVCAAPVRDLSVEPTALVVLLCFVVCILKLAIWQHLNLKLQFRHLQNLRLLIIFSSIPRAQITNSYITILVYFNFRMKLGNRVMSSNGREQFLCPIKTQSCSFPEIYHENSSNTRRINCVFSVTCDAYGNS